MSYIVIIYFLAIYIQITITFQYNNDYNDDDEKQAISQSFTPRSEPIHRLSASILDSLSQSNISLISLSYTDQTINLDGLGITNIEANTFINYRMPVTTINLSSNFLSYLPNNLFQVFRSTLIHLNLQHNQFYSLRKNLFLRRLEYLRTLDLSKNQLNELYKEDFTGLRRLETLILRENKLNYLPYAIFSRCRTITTLDLSDNNLSMIDSSAFRSLYRLKILLLSNNPLGQRSLTNYLMEPLKNLEYLDIENTKLTNLQPFLFISNKHLKSIKLRRNNFQTKLPNSYYTLQRTFCHANSLIEIDLVSTHIHSLDVCTYDQIPSLRRLYLMNNPLNCNCDLFYLKYGDIYRALLTDGHGIDRLHTDIDAYLDRWISRPELRRHLENSYARGDFHRLPIELSLFARCATPKQWSGREIGNITGIFRQCQHRWLNIEQECQNYCHLDNKIQTFTLINNILLTSFYWLVYGDTNENRTKSISNDFNDHYLSTFTNDKNNEIYKEPFNLTVHMIGFGIDRSNDDENNKQQKLVNKNLSMTNNRMPLLSLNQVLNYSENEKIKELQKNTPLLLLSLMIRILLERIAECTNTIQKSYKVINKSNIKNELKNKHHQFYVTIKELKNIFDNDFKPENILIITITILSLAIFLFTTFLTIRRLRHTRNKFNKIRTDSLPIKSKKDHEETIKLL